MSEPNSPNTSNTADRLFAWTTICILAAPAGVVLSGVSSAFIGAGQYRHGAYASTSRWCDNCTPARSRQLHTRTQRDIARSDRRMGRTKQPVPADNGTLGERIRGEQNHDRIPNGRPDGDSKRVADAR